MKTYQYLFHLKFGTHLNLKQKISIVVNVLNKIHDPKETGKADIINGVKIKN